MTRMKLVLFILFSVGLPAIMPQLNAQKPAVQSLSCYEPLGVSYSIIRPTADGYLLARSGKPQYGTFTGIPDIVISHIDGNGNEVWQKTYGGNKKEYVIQIEEHTEGRYYVLGATESSNGQVQSGNKGGFDIWILLIDATGQLLWEKTYGTAGDDYPVRMEKLTDGSLLVCGNIDRQGGDVDTAYGGVDIWFYRIDTLGNILWQKTLGAEGNNECTDFIINDKGNIVLTGTNAGDYFSACYAPENQNILLMETDLEGKILWNRCYGSWSTDYGGVVAQCKDGYVFAAIVRGDGEYVEGFHHNPNAYPPPTDIWLVRTDWQGFIIWKKCLGGSNDDFPVSLIVDEADDIYLFGNTNSDDHDVQRLIGNYGDNADIWMLKFFSSGEFIYQRCIGGTKDEGLSSKSSVCFEEGKRFKLAACTNSSKSGDVTCEHNYYPTYTFFWLVEIERCNAHETGIPGQPSGNTAVYSLSEPETEYAVIPSDNNWRFEWQMEPAEAGLIINQGLSATAKWAAGYSGEGWLSVRAYSACGFSDWSSPLMINVQNTYGTGLQLTTGLRLWPNPADDMLNIAFPAATHLPVQLTLSDLTGRVLLSQEISQPHSVISLSGLPRGAYFCRLASKDLNVSTKIIKRLKISN